MNAENIAALGWRRGDGESLYSWLRAGPLGLKVVDYPVWPGPIDGAALYCPACRVEEAGRRRWYTRGDWPPQAVVCTTHALPLLRFDTPPARLCSRRWSPSLRAEFRALGIWTQQGCGGAFGNLITRAVCARTDPSAAYSSAWAAAQWHLWSVGWPVPYAPRLQSCGPLSPQFQFDRLALMAIVRHLCVAMEAGHGTLWPSLHLRSRVFRWLERRTGAMRIAPYFCPLK